MSLIKKPSELSVESALSALIYGMPGAGKTSLAVSAPSPIHFDFDGGVNRIDAHFKVDTVQMTGMKWEDAIAALDEVVNEHPEYETIVIDTVGKMMMYMEEYIKRTMAPTNPSLLKRDGSLSLKGFGVRKQMFIDFNNRLKMAGRNVIYVAHEIEGKQRVANEEITVKRPEIPGSSINDLIKELDLVGYLWFNAANRVINFDPQESFYAKNSCGMHGSVPVPNVGPNDGNNFMANVVAAFNERLRQGQDDTARYDSLKRQIEERANQISSAKDANDFVEWAKSIGHVFNTKAVALQALSQRAAELKLEFNKSTKLYSDGPAA